MRINVKAKPLAGKERVVKISENYFEVWVKEPPVKGLANIAQSRIRLVSGFSSRNKIFEIE